MNDKKKGLFKSLLIYAIIIGGIFLIVHLVGAPRNQVKKLSYSELLTWIEQDIKNHKEIEGADADKTVKSVIIPPEAMPQVKGASPTTFEVTNPHTNIEISRETNESDGIRDVGSGFA